MQTVSVAIIGGGLSGLYAAYLLEKKGVDYVLLEARPTLGGRIVTARATDPNTA
jgi:monoamine oxidase